MEQRRITLTVLCDTCNIRSKYVSTYERLFKGWEELRSRINFDAWRIDDDGQVTCPTCLRKENHARSIHRSSTK